MSRGTHRGRCFDLQLVTLVGLLFLTGGAHAGCSICTGPHSPLPNGTFLPCAPGNDLCPDPSKYPNATALHCPRSGTHPYNDHGFHIRDATCGLNDPNGPVYDAVHGVYHLFYQDHLGVGENGGTSWGHVVSRDLAHWARLPVALWNDEIYDNHAIWSGSATVVNGEIVIVYPGLCSPEVACDAAGGTWMPANNTCTVVSECVSGRNLALAKPANGSASGGDPLLTKWRKTGVIVNSSATCDGHCPNATGDIGKDPSAAWRTPSGEWRIVTGDAPYLYGSMDFKSWYFIGLGFNGAGGDCPSFFPIPTKTPGSGSAPNATSPKPTHVHMRGGGSTTLGVYDAGEPRTIGSFTPLDDHGASGRKADHGEYYATKDFFDPVKKRRILWGWAVPPLNAESLPREVTWNPELQQLCYAPLAEQDSLRAAPLAVPTVPLHLGKNDEDVAVISTKWAKGVGAQSELTVTFALPDASALLGVVVMASAQDDDAASSSGTFFFVEFTAEAAAASAKEASATATTPPRSVVVGAMQNRTAAAGGSGSRLAFSCAAPGVKCSNDTLQLTASDTELTMRIFVDANLAECYWQTNRVAMIVTAPPPTGEEQVAATVTALVAVSDASSSFIDVTALNAWSVEDVWITPDEVLATPRLDAVRSLGTQGTRTE